MERIFRDRNNPLDCENDDEIISKYRLPRSIILELIELVRDDAEFQTFLTYAIYPSLQVIIALRFLATGSLCSTIAQSTGVSKSSVSRIVRRFCNAVSARVNEYRTSSSM